MQILLKNYSFIDSDIRMAGILLHYKLEVILTYVFKSLHKTKSMKWMKNVEFMERVMSLIRRKATGDAANFANKLDMSERNVQRLISDMRSAGFPIKYCKQSCTYYFDESVQYEFTLKVGDDDLLKIKGGGLQEIDDYFIKEKLKI